ncbi:MAG: GTP cyclohydrolase FolE2 [Brevinematia bacterium]
MRDVQNEKDLRNIPINKVGVNNVKYPISVIDRSGAIQHTVATINMYVDLPHHYRGTHMSRFLEVISRHSVNLNLHNLDAILKDIKKLYECEVAHLEIAFPYFLNKKAPVSKIESPLEYECKVECELDNSEKLKLITQVKVPIHTLCPCSKEISEFGGHNQRADVIIRIKSSKLVWFEELIEIAEKSASAPIFSLLKRRDEKFITETAYKNPKFVEDVARDVVLQLRNDKRISWYSVEVISYESIHKHNAYACILKE